VGLWRIQAWVVYSLLCNRQVEKFQQHYNDTLAKCDTPPKEIVAVAHSFGTYILGNAIRRFPEIHFDRVLLLGSVLKPNFEWPKLLVRCPNVLNIVCGADWVLRLTKWLPWLGKAGLDGFICKGEQVKEHREAFSEHSDLFGDGYMEQVWLPYLREGTCPADNNGGEVQQRVIDLAP
jgi:hypothetical protein